MIRPFPGRPHRPLAALALALAACAGARGGPRPSPAAAAIAEAAPGPRRFDFPGHGALWLDVPRGWSVRTGDADPPLAPTIELAPPGRPFVLLLTPVWRPAEGDAPADADSAQLLAELARRSAIPQAEEGEALELRELSGPEVRGFWFEATAREPAGAAAPGPGRRRLLQGAAAVGPILVAFSIAGDAAGSPRDLALGIVRAARHSADGAPPPSPGAAATLEPDPDAPTVPLSAGLPGRRWTALVDLPGFRAFRPRPAEGGRGVLVVGEGPERGLVASLILLESQARDARACREEALARIQAGVPELRALRRADPGAASRASYEVPARDGPAAHAHAFLARDGVCVNLHLSWAGAGGEDGAGVEAILASLRFGESL